MGVGDRVGFEAVEVGLGEGDEVWFLGVVHGSVWFEF